MYIAFTLQYKCQKISDSLVGTKIMQRNFKKYNAFRYQPLQSQRWIGTVSFLSWYVSAAIARSVHFHEQKFSLLGPTHHCFF